MAGGGGDGVFSSLSPVFLAMSLVFFVILLLLLCYLFYPALVAAQKAHNPQPPREEILVVDDDEHDDDNADDRTSSGTKRKGRRRRRRQPLLSVVVPAYNEEDRLPEMLESAYAYLSRPDCLALRHLSLSARRRRRRQHEEEEQEDSVNANGESSTTTTTTAATRRRNNNGQEEEEDLGTVVVEWIVVSDGSTDRTEDVYRQFVDRTFLCEAKDIGGTATAKRAKSNLTAAKMTAKLVGLDRNSGKGAAVQSGMVAANGEYLLMVDADGATRFSCLEWLTEHVAVPPAAVTARRNHPDSAAATNESSTAEAATPCYPLVWGSRAHLQDTNERHGVRNFLMQCFNVLVRLLCGAYVRDTQCGFKLFERAAADKLFGALHLQRWAFDTELVVLSNRLGLPIKEVDVDWREVEGSKLHTSLSQLALVAIGMLRDMVCVRLCYGLGLWRVGDTIARRRSVMFGAGSGTGANRRSKDD